MRIIFMGTPDFAVPALKALINSSHEVIAVFTQAPKPYGRGMQVQKSKVHAVAAAHNLTVYTPKSLRSSTTQQLIKDLAADLIVVVAYGFIIPASILYSTRYGCINIHPSDLPKQRGPAPLPYVILSGEPTSAVCLIKMDEGVDTGDVIIRKEFTVPADITLPQLHDYTAGLGAKLLIQALECGLEKLSPVQQNDADASYTAKLSKLDGQINWQESAEIIERRIRALNPWPGVYFSHLGQQIKILAASYDLTPHKKTPGTVLSLSPSLAIACGQGILYPKILQRASKQALELTQFLLGYNFPLHTILD